MDISVSITRPAILCEQALGTVLVCHQPSLAELVLIRVAGLNEQSPRTPDPNQMVSVVVLSSKVSEGEIGHFPVGRLLEVVGDAPVTALMQVEPASFRAAEPKTISAPPLY